MKAHTTVLPQGQTEVRCTIQTQLPAGKKGQSHMGNSTMSMSVHSAKARSL